MSEEGAVVCYQSKVEPDEATSDSTKIEKITCLFTVIKAMFPLGFLFKNHRTLSEELPQSYHTSDRRKISEPTD